MATLIGMAVLVFVAVEAPIYIPVALLGAIAPAVATAVHHLTALQFASVWAAAALAITMLLGRAPRGRALRPTQLVDEGAGKADYSRGVPDPLPDVPNWQRWYVE